jgi:Bacterial Ig-like domain
MRKTLLLFPTMALALLLAAGTAWAALPAPTVASTVPPNGATDVVRTADITATFSEAMSTKSFQILNHSTTTPPSTDSSKTFYLLKGHFIGSATKNPPRFCAPPGTTPSTSSPRCPQPIAARVSYTALTATLNPTTITTGLEPNRTYTAVVEGAGDGDKVAVKDADGTPMASDRIFSFTTGP